MKRSPVPGGGTILTCTVPGCFWETFAPGEQMADKLAREHLAKKHP